MKRPKKIVAGSEAQEALSSFRPWGAWCWLAVYNGSQADSRDFATELGELNWVRQQLTHVIDILPVQFDSREVLPIQQHQVKVAMLLDSDRPSRSSLAPLTDPSLILLASASRSDPIDEAATILGRRYPDASIRLVLGDWWAGHQRTSPIAKKHTSIYWYQCHDVLLPELLAQSDTKIESTSVFQTALVVSDDSSIRQMWLELLPTLHYLPLAVRVADCLPEGNVDVVFYDQSFAVTGHNSHSQTASNPGSTLDADQVAILRRTYPSSKIVVCFSFPRWNDVSQCIQAGADFILGKPFRLEGIAKLLDHETRRKVGS